MNLHLSSLWNVLKTYCINSSIAGLSYIADSRYHWSERLFWMACLVFSTFGVAHFIEDTINDYNNDASSMFFESVHPFDHVDFPTFAVCEFGSKDSELPELFSYIESLSNKDETDESNLYDVLDFMSLLFFFNLYWSGGYSAHCSMYVDDPEMVQCPQNNYHQLSFLARTNCSKLISNCMWRDKPFDCCEYFRPLTTGYGTCFLLNSQHGLHWLDTKMGLGTGPGWLQVDYSTAVTILIINEFDVPHPSLKQMRFDHRYGTLLKLWIAMQTVENGDGFSTLDVDRRGCIFPDEPFETRYRFYSFSVCITECLKLAQVRTCNCSHPDYIHDDDDPTPECDYNGLLCIDSNKLVKPSNEMLTPWKGDACDCLPSCLDHELKLIGQAIQDIDIEGRRSLVKLIGLPTLRYQRYLTKSIMDFVVAAGGILSLFLGASILTVGEFFYFVIVRILGNRWMNRRQNNIE